LVEAIEVTEADEDSVIVGVVVGVDVGVAADAVDVMKKKIGYLSLSLVD
jgi:hypothetical protein